ncbi:MAG: hypothetical protein K6U00_04210, partial [Armatimonadetes bacterium]|nr:hypothetical protein [Armatimonadota bacterium]
GAPLVFRRGNDVFISISETGEGVPPLCNTRWQLWRRNSKGWHLVNHEPDFVEREPCPLGGLSDGRIFLSVNPSKSPSGTMYGCDCEPHLLQFHAEHLNAPPKVLRPPWPDEAHFTEHSYRALAVDAQRQELLIVNTHSDDGSYFTSLLDASGTWHVGQRLRFPIRSCYPPVVLRDRAAHVLAISDIVEPNEEWRNLKYEILKSDWDYVFRRLFYTFSPDITSQPFVDALEIDNVEDTAGMILPMDLYVDDNERVHLLYTRVSHQYSFMRDRYFPDQPIITNLMYVTLEKEKVANRKAIINHVEGSTSLLSNWARFHPTPDGCLNVIAYGTWIDDNGTSKEGNFLINLSRDKSPEPIALAYPMTRFFTNTPRGGSAPSEILDLYGTNSTNPLVLRYAKVVLS